jgi:heme exporter protein CcmD
MSPYFATLQDFLHMGGYAAYVWPAYTAVAVVLAVVAVKSRRKISAK